jgi:hypothetical protein
MAWLERTKQIITGKTTEERLKDKFANQQIRKEVQTAQLLAQREARIKYAKERTYALEKAKFERYKKTLEPRKYQGFNSIGGPFGNAPQGNSFSIFGQPQKPTTQVITKRVPIRPKKKAKYKIVRRVVTQKAQQPERFRII